MRMILSLQIALRFISNIKQNGMVSLVSIVSIVSIALGVAVLIISLSAINGFEYELNNRILAIVPHGEIEPVSPPFIDWLTALQRIKKIPGILSAAPYLDFTGLIEHKEKLQAIQIKGVDPILEMHICALPRYVKDHAWLHFQAGKKQLIVGEGVANTLKIKPGDWVTAIIPSNNSQEKLKKPQRIRLQIKGIFEIHSQIDHNFAIVPLLDAQNYLQRKEDISGIAIKVNNTFNIKKLIREAGKATSNYVRVRSWIDFYGYMYRDIKIIRTIIYLTIILVISIAYFSIISTLVIAIRNKDKDIAILYTLGAQNKLIHAIFIWYGLLAGSIGSTIGEIIGVITVLKLNALVKMIEHLLGHQILSGNIYFIDFIPTKLHWVNIITVIVITLSLSFLASWIPVHRLNQKNPAYILRKR